MLVGKKLRICLMNKITNKMPDFITEKGYYI